MKESYSAFYEQYYDWELVLSGAGTDVYHIKPRLRRIGYSLKSVSPPDIWILLIPANIDQAPDIWLCFNRSSVTLDSNEAHYSVEKIRKWESVNIQPNRLTLTHHNKKNTSHLMHSFPSRDRDHTACRAIASLPPLCIYHSETNGLLVEQHFNAPWGVCRRHIYQHSFISLEFYFNSWHTNMHKQKETKGHTTYLLMECSIMGQSKRHSFQTLCPRDTRYKTVWLSKDKPIMLLILILFSLAWKPGSSYQVASVWYRLQILSLILMKLILWVGFRSTCTIIAHVLIK